jgi:hypothetical protein
MIAKVPCNLTNSDPWGYNIDSGADSYPLIALCPLAMSGRDDHHDFLAPHTSGPRDVPRCGALSLLQKDAALQGDPAETAVG